MSRVRTLVLDGSADSLKDIAVIAHRVKGSAAAYGFPLLTKVAKNLEAAARVGDLRLVSELMADWKAFLDRARL